MRRKVPSFDLNNNKPGKVKVSNLRKRNEKKKTENRRNEKKNPLVLSSITFKNVGKTSESQNKR